MNTRVRLTDIPQEIQDRYDIGASVEAAAGSEVLGGTFSFTNKLGAQVEVDAVELSGTDIKVQKI